MLKLIVSLWLALMATVSAHAQSLVIINQPPYSGTAIGSGYDVGANGPLYALTSSSLQSLKLPFSYSFDFLIPYHYFPPDSLNSFYLTGGQANGGSTGFNLQNNDQSTTDSFRDMNVIKPAGGSSACDNNANGNMCWRVPNDGLRHNWCTVWNANHGYYYVDGVLRDETVDVGTFTAGTSTWQIGNGNGALAWPPGVKFWDFRVYNRALTSDECVQLQDLQQANLIPSSGSLTNGMVVNWPLNNCTISGLNYSCADSTGNGNTVTNDKNPPTLVITSPAAGTVSGTTVSIQSTCTDILPCTQVCYFVDGVLITPTCPTTGPTFTYSWDSTKVIDGLHTLTAVATNTGGVTGTSPGVVITASNVVSAKTVYVDSVGGSDTNNCLTTGTACKTLAHIQSAITLLGGDTLALLQGDTFTNTTGFQLCGPRSGCSKQTFYPSADVLTVTTYGGGTCNPFTLTATGCATIQVSGANAYIGIEGINTTNLTINNLNVSGGGAAAFSFCQGDGGNNGAGIDIHATSGLTISNVTIQNNWIHNYSCGVAFNMGNPSSTITNYLVTDNVVSGALPTTSVTQGIRAGGGTQGTIENNLVFNIGGASEQGNCILPYNYPSPAGVSTPTLVQFNVCHDFGQSNVGTAGGPIGIYAINTNLATYQFNESYRGLPPGYPTIPPGSFDYDCYDIDTGSTNIIMQYNYAHDCPIQSGFNIITQAGQAANPNPNWNNVTVRYNIAENNAICFGGGGSNQTNSNSYIYNNTCSTNLAPQQQTFQVCWLAFALVLANNICVYTGTAPASYVNFPYNSLPIPASFVMLNNDYYATNTSPVWYFNKLFTSPTAYTTLLAWQNASGLDAGSLNVNPLFSGTPSTAGTCWGGGTSPPAGPQNAPSAGCPSVYQLTTGSPAIGTGLDLTQAPYNQNVGTRDYYGGSIPNGIGSGYNMGADGAHH